MLHSKNWLRFAKTRRRRWNAPQLEAAIPTLPLNYLGCFETPALAKAHARATAIFVDEFDAGDF